MSELRLKTVSISEFWTRCYALLHDVQKKKRSLIITMRGRPMAVVKPFLPAPKRIKLGALKGQMKILGDIIRSDIEEDFLVR